MWQGLYTFTVNQWGVGHGGFHSQSLFLQPLDCDAKRPVGDGYFVRVIYDCGSGRTVRPRKAFMDAVTRMLDDVAGGSRIDLLVISHFDRDHVNGLEYLAAELVKRKIQVARIWAPLLTKVEALVAISKSGLKGVRQQAYAALVIDPGGRLGDLFEGAEVTQIAPDDRPIPLSPNGAGGDNADVGSDGDISLKPVLSGWGLIVGPGAGSAGEALWEFQPYVVESSLAGAKSVAASLSNILKKPLDQCSLADLIEVANDSKLLKRFHFAVRRHQVKVARQMRTSSARTAPNLSSLCVYSGPVSPYDWFHLGGRVTQIGMTLPATPVAPAWLGTGDAGLLGTQPVDAMQIALTQGRLDRVGISSAPHHGSRHDSDVDLWKALPNARWVTIEAKSSTGGTGNTHPHKQVLIELSTRNLTMHVAVDGNDFRWIDQRIRL